jgi:uncharacterized protein (TIGR02001 family)
MSLQERAERISATAGAPARAGRPTRSWLPALLLLPVLSCRADGPWSASIGATTDFIDRGVSQTYGGAALQLGVNYQSPVGWFAGVWGSNVDPYPFADSSREIDVYGGFSWSLASDFTARATYSHYLYLQDPRPIGYDYNEVALSVTYLDRLVATVSYQPDVTSTSLLGHAYKRPMVGYEISSRWPLRGRFALTGGVGYYDLHRLFGLSYWAGSAGLAYVDRRLSIDLARFVSDRTVARLYEDASANGTWALSAVYRF